jgi:hypothetical protein
MNRVKKLLNAVNDFYPEYLKAHDDAVNQVFHFIGASFFWILIGLFFIQFNLWYIVAAIFIGYLLPGIGHHFFQHNKSFWASKPILCVLCAFWLYIDTLTFQVGKKMKRIRTARSL